MSGMSLRTGVTLGASFNPSMPVAAKAPSAPTQGGNGRRSIAQRAYGVGGGTYAGKSSTAIGSVGVGIAALAALIFIWWSLPR